MPINYSIASIVSITIVHSVINYICVRNRQIKHKSVLILLSCIHQLSLYVLATKDYLLNVTFYINYSGD